MPSSSFSLQDPVPTVQEAGWASGPVWLGAENLVSTGIRSPDRPVRGQSLYRLSYRAHRLPMCLCNYELHLWAVSMNMPTDSGYNTFFRHNLKTESYFDQTVTLLTCIWKVPGWDPGQRPTIFSPFQIFFSPTRQIRESTWNWATTATFHIPPNDLL
jgi:hypothetical protein